MRGHRIYATPHSVASAQLPLHACFTHSPKNIMNKTCASVLKLFAASLLGMTLSLSAVAQVPLINPSFESPILEDGQIISPLPDGFGWTIRGNVDLVNGVKGTAEVPMGRQWIQMRSGTAIFQQVSLQPGVYYVTLHAMTNSGPGQTVRASMDGVLVPVLTPTSTTSQQTFTGFSISAAGTYTLQIDLPDPPAGATTASLVLIDNIVLNKQGTNSTPSVAISAPVHGQSYPDIYMTVVAIAIDPDGSISKVEFYDGATLLGTAYSPPYAFDLTLSTVGTKNLTAKAYDNLNLTTTSTPVVISHSAGTAKPYVADGGFEYPRLPFQTVIGVYPYYDATPWQTTGGFIASNGALMPGFSNIGVGAFTGRQSAFADAQYAGVGVQQPVNLPAGQYGLSYSGNLSYNNAWNVQFGGVDFGSSYYGPTRHATTITSAGGVQYLRFFTGSSYQYGAFSSLDDVKIGPVGLPIVTTSVAAPSTTLTAPTAIRLMAGIEVYDRTITQVQFFNGSTLIGSTAYLPATFDWLNVPPGSYSITTKVTDSKGYVTTSAPLPITVNVPTAPAFFNANFEYARDWSTADWSSISGWTIMPFYTCYYCAMAVGKGYSLTPPGTIPPEGAALAVIKGGGWMQQQVYMPEGSYKIGFKASQLGGGTGQTFQVVINGIAIGMFTPTASFVDYQTIQFSVGTTGTNLVGPTGIQTVRFESTTPGISTYAGLDDLRIVVMPNAPTVTNSFNPVSVVVNGTATMTIAVTNPNAVALTGVAFTNTYPAGLTNSGTPATTISAGCGGGAGAVANGNTFTLASGNIPANTTCTYAVQVQATTTGAKINSTGGITSANAPTGAAATATLDVTQILAAPVVAAYAVRQSDPPPSVSFSFSQNSAVIGSSVLLTMTLQNANAAALTGVAFAVSYPAGLSNSTSSGIQSSCAGATLDAPGNAGYFTIANATLPASTTCTYTVNLNPTTVGTKTISVGAVTSQNAMPTTGNSAVLNVVTNPGPPSNVVATAGNVPGDYGAVIVTFSPSTSDGGMPIHHYAAHAIGYPFGGEWFCASPCNSIRVFGNAGFQLKIRVYAQHVGQSVPAESNTVVAISTPWASGPAPRATAGNAEVTVSFNPTLGPAEGGMPIVSYEATSIPGNLTGRCTAPCSSITVTGLTNGVAYTFVVRGYNSIQGGPPTAPSNSVTPSGQPTTQPVGLYYVHADHLGSPRMITRASDDQVVWYWDNVDAFGNNPAVEQPTATAPRFQYNLRFPGQYYDQETGTNYNYFRDYDAVTGRYVQSDPIGLKGGINTYLYTMGNPLKWTDSRGLAIWICSRAVRGFPFWGNHVYLWDDQKKASCGMTGSAGVGSYGANEKGPEGDSCTKVPGSDGFEDSVMSCCTKNALVGVWVPVLNDCNSTADRCIRGVGLKNPGAPGGRLGRCDSCIIKPQKKGDPTLAGGPNR